MRAIVTIALFSILACATPLAAVSTSPLRSASSGEHLWIVRPLDHDDAPHAADLLHHSLEMGGPFAAATVPLGFVPAAIAASSVSGEASAGRIWVVSEPRPLTAGSARDVLTLQIKKRPEIDFYFTDPEGRFSIVDTLRGDGELVGFAATAEGPVALLRFARSRDRDQAGRESERTAAEDSRHTYRLYELRRNQWVASSIPTGFGLGNSATLTVDGPDLSRLNLLTSDPEQPNQTLLYRRDRHGWSARPIELHLDLDRVETLTQIRGRLAAVIRDENRSAIELAYLREGPPLVLTSIEKPAVVSWTVSGLSDGFRLISRTMPERENGAAASAAGVLTMRTIDWMSGEIGPEFVITRPRLPAARLLHISIMLTIAVVTVLLVLLVRPGTQRVAATSKGGGAKGSAASVSDGDLLELPKNMVILPLVPRMLALLIDLVPGGILALLALGVGPLELLRLPIITESLEQAAPYLVMIVITFVHVSLAEMMAGTSLGKLLMGGRVLGVQPNGSAAGKPSAVQVLIRNSLKLLILMVPPLAFFALLSRNLQGFNDILARTVVVGEIEQIENPEGDKGE